MIPKNHLESRCQIFSGLLVQGDCSKPINVTVAHFEEYMQISPEFSMQSIKYYQMYYKDIIGVEYFKSTTNTQSILIHLQSRDIQIEIKIQDITMLRDLLRIRIPQNNFGRAYKIKQIIKVLKDGEIAQCFCKADGKVYVAKMLKNSSSNYVQREIQINKILARNPHKNVLSMVEFFENEKETVLILPFMKGGTLNHYIAEKAKLQQIQVRKIMKQILKGLDHIHGLGIIHRDIKMDNIMIEEDDDQVRVKIIDYGLSIMKNEVDFYIERCGTVGYLAPEIIQYDQYNQNCDIFSLAQVFHILLTGNPMYDRNLGSGQILLLTVRGQLKIDRQAISSQKAIDLLENMMKTKDQRFSVTQCLNHEYFKQPKLIEKQSLHLTQSQLSLEFEVQIPFLSLKLKKHSHIQIQQYLLLITLYKTGYSMKMLKIFRTQVFFFIKGFILLFIISPSIYSLHSQSLEPSTLQFQIFLFQVNLNLENSKSQLIFYIALLNHYKYV